MPIIFGGGNFMFLTLIGSNFFINKNYIHNAAMAVISLRDEGTALDCNQDIIYNDVDNDKFREVCKDCLSKTTQLEYFDLRELNFWSQMSFAVIIIGNLDSSISEQSSVRPPKSPNADSPSTSSTKITLLFLNRLFCSEAGFSLICNCSLFLKSDAFNSNISRLSSFFIAYAKLVLPTPVGP